MIRTTWWSRTGHVALLALATYSLVTTARAELKAEPSTVDLGRARQQKTIDATVKLVNAGVKPLEIFRVAADCSCTAAVPEKTSLNPGESTDLKITFETRSYQGEVHRRLLVQTSDGDLALPVKAIVSAYDDWTLSGTTAILPPSNKGQVVQGTFSVAYTGKGSAKITGVSTSVSWLTAHLGEPKDDGTWTISLQKEAAAPAGNLQPKLTIATDDAHEKELSVPVFIAVYSTLAVRPNPILLPVGKVGQRTGAPFSISNWEGAADPRGEIEGGKVSVQKRDRGEVLLSLDVVPDQAGVSTRLLRLFSGESLEIEIPVVIRAER